MKPQNFPARKLRRQMLARGDNPDNPNNKALLEEARKIRTKKNRGQ